MALQVIGTGMGRKGTRSLKVALVQLGFAKYLTDEQEFLLREDGVFRGGY